MNDGPLINGIPALGPGEERKIDWGQYGGLIKNLGINPVIVKCIFKKNGKKMPPVECKLDVKSFEGTVAATVPIAKISRDIEKIQKAFHNLATGFTKINIITQTKSDYLREEQERREESKKILEDKKAKVDSKNKEK